MNPNAAPPGTNGSSDGDWYFWFDPFGAAGRGINQATGGGISAAVSATADPIAAAGQAGSNIAGAAAFDAAAGLVLPILAIFGLVTFGPSIAKKVGL